MASKSYLFSEIKSQRDGNQITHNENLLGAAVPTLISSPPRQTNGLVITC
jgi:hypothetical protein